MNTQMSLVLQMHVDRSFSLSPGDSEFDTCYIHVGLENLFYIAATARDEIVNQNWTLLAEAEAELEMESSRDLISASMYFDSMKAVRRAL